MMTKRYVFGLTFIGLLACLIFGVVTMMIVSQKDHAYVIQMAARQRSLSLKLVWLYRVMMESKKEDERLQVSQSMAQIIGTMEGAHQTLLGENPTIPLKVTPLMAAVFHDHPYLLDEKLKDFLGAMKQVSKGATSMTQLNSIAVKWDAQTIERLLDGFDLIVNYLQKEAQESSRQYLLIISFIILLLISSVILEALFIFRPMLSFATKKGMEVKMAQKLVEGIMHNSSNKNMRQTMLISQLSHELQHSINAILTAVDILKEEKATKRQKHHVDQIENSANMLGLLVNDIMDYAYIELGELVLNADNIHIRDFVESVVSLQQKGLVATGVELKCDIDPETPQVIQGDMGRLEQILSNMIKSAADEMDEGGELLIHILGHVDVQNSVVFKMTVVDSSLEDKVKALEIRKDWRPEGDVPGFGLRLRVCQQLSNCMGGDLFVRTLGSSGRLYHCFIKLSKDESDFEG